MSSSTREFADWEKPPVSMIGSALVCYLGLCSGGLLAAPFIQYASRCWSILAWPWALYFLSPAACRDGSSDIPILWLAGVAPVVLMTLAAGLALRKEPVASDRRTFWGCMCGFLAPLVLQIVIVIAWAFLRWDTRHIQSP